MLFFPVSRQVSVTDGNAAPGSHAAPADLRNITPFLRSGADVAVAESIFERGPYGRASKEYGYLRQNELAFTDLSMEMDDTTTTGTSEIFEVGDVHYAQERIIQCLYATGHTLTGNCLVGSVSIEAGADDVVMMTVPLRGTGSLTSVGL